MSFNGQIRRLILLILPRDVPLDRASGDARDPISSNGARPLDLVLNTRGSLMILRFATVGPALITNKFD